MNKQEKKDLHLLVEYEYEKWRWLFNIPMPKFLTDLIALHISRKVVRLYDRVENDRQKQKERGKNEKMYFYIGMN